MDKLEQKSTVTPATPAIMPAWKSISVWLLATVLTSSAAVLTHYTAGKIPAASVGFWRVFGAALFLSPWCIVAWLREGRPPLFTLGTTLAGLLFGLHFATWSWALQNTTIANAMLFIGLQPLMAPFWARPLLGERLNRREIIGCLLAGAGMVWILGGKVGLSAQDLRGSAVAFVSAFLCAGYFVLTRKYRKNTDPFVFGVPVFLTAAIVQAVIGFAFGDGIQLGDQTAQAARWAMLGLVLFPTVGGHMLAIFLLRHISSQMMTLSVPSQFVISTVAAMFLFGQKMTLAFAVGAVIVMTGVALGVAAASASKAK